MTTQTECSRQIDTFNETIMSLDEGAKHVSEISGKKRNRRILVRWSNRGVAGVKLPTIRVGSELYTSREALNWFLNASQEAKRSRHSEATTNGIRLAKCVEQQAQELGI